ncbi:CPBP family intramembrane glutamic endopeptidase [Rubrivirga sp. IMCC45206]|uniref:CPBP family intramembrane glutamic endopeptidase n=1 Tax=Rubrivirga sp. IMCC45206 TaxID=3391614 RepID=UPI00398FCE5D
MLLALLFLVPAASAQTVRLTIPLDADRPARAALGPRAIAEMGAVALTGVGHLAASQAGVSNLYVPVVVVGWGGYLGARALREPGVLSELGLTGTNLGRATRDVALVSAGTVLAMGAYGAANGSLRVEPSLVPLLVLYPAWGLTQQLLVQGFVTRHLDAAGLPAVAVVPLSAATFGSVHAPNWPLTAATTVMGGAFAGLYLRDQNVWPLGVAHGALGTLFYVWVLDRDPWAEFIGQAD